MFKRLVKQITEVSNMEDYNAACGAIDMAFQQEKVSWTDHELLYTLLGKIRMN